jgi:microcompartment protein CcmK/EutM
MTYESSKFQIPSSREDPIPKHQQLLGTWLFGAWGFELLWDLELGPWSFFVMKLGTVIGRVTLSKTVPALIGARWLIVSPFSREHYQRGAGQPPVPSNEMSLVVYDNLGGGTGQTIGFIEGREAASPFSEPTPIDAINAALVDDIFYSPLNPAPSGKPGGLK